MNEINLILIVIVVALGGDLLLSVARMSLGTVRRAHLFAMEDEKPRQVRRTLELLRKQPRVNAALRLAHMAFRVFVMGSLLVALAPWKTTSTVWPKTLGVLLLGSWALTLIELVVEGAVMQSQELWALRLTPMATLLYRLFTPLLALSFVSYSPSTRTPSNTEIEAELKDLVIAGEGEGILEQDKQKMIFSIFRFRDTLAREVMVPRIDMVALEIDTPLMEAVNALLKSGFSRVPVYKETIDNIKGLLYARDLLRVWQEGQQIESLEHLIRPPYFVPEAKRADELLAEMQAQHFHMAIVIDEYGGVAGLVTLEDIVEEIVGEIQDEYDLREEQALQQLSDDEFIFQGRFDLDDFNQLMNTKLPADEADTLGGFLYSRIGRVPTGGEQVVVDDLLLTVEVVSGRRIRKVRVTRISSSPEIVKEPHDANE
ncbi:MAG: hemolysin family protein [Chloroflexota bacterium]